MPSNENLKLKRQQQGVYRKNAQKGAMKRTCPRCGRMAATTTHHFPTINQNDSSKTDITTVVQCRWCSFKEVTVLNTETRENEVVETSITYDFSVGAVVFIFIDPSHGWQKADVQNISGTVTKILHDRKGVRYRIQCQDGRLRTRFAYEMRSNRDDI